MRTAALLVFFFFVYTHTVYIHTRAHTHTHTQKTCVYLHFMTDSIFGLYFLLKNHNNDETFASVHDCSNYCLEQEQRVNINCSL